MERGSIWHSQEGERDRPEVPVMLPTPGKQHLKVQISLDSDREGNDPERCGLSLYNLIMSHFYQLNNTSPFFWFTM